MLFIDSTEYRGQRHNDDRVSTYHGIVSRTDPRAEGSRDFQNADVQVDWETGYIFDCGNRIAKLSITELQLLDLGRRVDTATDASLVTSNFR